MSAKKIGVFICHCGGNISDYVDVEQVRQKVENEPGVAVAKTQMFACSDASQQEMIDEIQKNDLDGIVVASCSPKLHLYTFRGAAERAGLNPYQYTQVNLREQCSWAHRENVTEATDKGIRLVRAGISKTRLSNPMSTLRIETKLRALVIGAGASGMRAALALADMGLAVYLIEKSAEVGGWTGKWGRMYPNDQRGTELIGQLHEEIRKRDNITIYTEAELIEKSGSLGDFTVKIQVRGIETVELNVGAVVVATGFDAYQPSDGEFGYGMEGVVTLPEFKQLLDSSNGTLRYKGRRVRDIAYIYCVGSRQSGGGEGSNSYCSRYCCTAACHSAVLASETDEEVNQFHLYRDIRTYGGYELIYEQAGRKGSAFYRYKEKEPPTVEATGDKLRLTMKDQLVGGEEIEMEVDLVVLVTGMVPRENEKLAAILKLPIGRDGFFNEIHPKLRPVETVIDGVFIAGTSQGPKSLAESVASALSGASKTAGLLMKGYVDLEPFIAEVDTDRCTWCGECLKACPYDAIEKLSISGKEVAHIIPALCKGGGACVPVCPEDAIDLRGYTDEQIKEMIDSMIEEKEAV